MINIGSTIFYSTSLFSFYKFGLHRLESAISYFDTAKRLNGVLIFFYIVTGNQYEARLENFVRIFLNFFRFKHHVFALFVLNFAWLPFLANHSPNLFHEVPKNYQQIQTQSTRIEIQVEQKIQKRRKLNLKAIPEMFDEIVMEPQLNYLDTI
jgi:hypothetical protein